MAQLAQLGIGSHEDQKAVMKAVRQLLHAYERREAVASCVSEVVAPRPLMTSVRLTCGGGCGGGVGGERRIRRQWGVGRRRWSSQSCMRHARRTSKQGGSCSGTAIVR